VLEIENISGNVSALAVVDRPVCGPCGPQAGLCLKVSGFGLGGVILAGVHV